MQPTTISATSIARFEDCEASFKAHHIDKVPDLQNNAALRGIVIHGVLEEWVAREHHTWKKPFSTMEGLLNNEYYKHFSDPEFFDEIRDELKRWHMKQNWTDREVISTELKERFPLKVNHNGREVEFPVTYIWDRVDDLSGGDRKIIEVVDYKSWIMPRQPADMKNSIQVRIYALAAQMKWKDAEEIWVTYDQTRYDQVSIRVTKEENRATYKYLKAVARRLLDSDGTRETLNEGCNFCVRRGTCDTMRRHVHGGGVLSATQDLGDAVRELERWQAAKKVAMDMVPQLQSFIFDKMEEQDVTGSFDTLLHEVKVASKKVRHCDSERVRRVIPDEVAKDYIQIKPTDIDKIIKSGVLTPEQEDDVKALIIKTPGKPYLRIKRKNEIT